MTGNAHHQRGENKRGNDGFDKAEENIAEDLQTAARFVPEIADGNPQKHSEKYLRNKIEFEFHLH